MSEPHNPFAPRPRGGYDNVITAIKTWTRDAMELAPDELVSVTEFACTIPGCPPRETVIVVMPNKGHWLRARVHKAMPDVTFEDILWSLRYAERVERRS